MPEDSQEQLFPVAEVRINGRCGNADFLSDPA
jgi:hypothetical protein